MLWNKLKPLQNNPKRFKKTFFGESVRENLRPHPSQGSNPERIRRWNPRIQARRFLRSAHSFKHNSGYTRGKITILVPLETRFNLPQFYRRNHFKIWTIYSHKLTQSQTLGCAGSEFQSTFKKFQYLYITNQSQVFYTVKQTFEFSFRHNKRQVFYTKLWPVYQDRIKLTVFKVWSEFKFF